MLLALPDALVGRIALRLRGADFWRLRCASNKIREMILKMFPPRVQRDLDVYFVMLAFQHVDIPYDDAFVINLMSVEWERQCFNYTDTFRNWVHRNRVCIDAGGFYVCLQGSKRVRIGWWERGAVIGLVKEGIKLRRKYVAVNGFTVYEA